MRIGIAVLFAIGICAALQAQTRISSAAAEQELFSSVNRARRSQGLPLLKQDEALAVAARLHANAMARHNSAQHVFPGEPSLPSRAKQAGANFVWLAENVIQGSAVQAIEEEFLRSPNHRANILDSDMNSVGVGVVERNGQFFAVEDFSKAK